MKAIGWSMPESCLSKVGKISLNPSRGDTRDLVLMKEGLVQTGQNGNKIDLSIVTANKVKSRVPYQARLELKGRSPSKQLPLPGGKR